MYFLKNLRILLKLFKNIDNFEIKYEIYWVFLLI